MSANLNDRLLRRLAHALPARQHDDDRPHRFEVDQDLVRKALRNLATLQDRCRGVYDPAPPSPAERAAWSDALALLAHRLLTGRPDLAGLTDDARSMAAAWGRCGSRFGEVGSLLEDALDGGREEWGVLVELLEGCQPMLMALGGAVDFYTKRLEDDLAADLRKTTRCPAVPAFGQTAATSGRK